MSDRVNLQAGYQSVSASFIVIDNELFSNLKC